MKRIIKNTIFLILFCVLSTLTQAQISETELKAAYIERFTRFIEWPTNIDNNTEKTNFVITVLGDNTYGSSLNNLFNEYKIKELPVTLKYTNNYNEIIESNIVIICNSERKKLRETLKFLETKPILIISDSKDFAKEGTYINMYLDGNRVRYEINLKAIEKTGLKVSSLLLNSAKIVETDD